jgi:hypothetical protein
VGQGKGKPPLNPDFGRLSTFDGLQSSQAGQERAGVTRSKRREERGEGRSENAREAERRRRCDTIRCECNATLSERVCVQ